MTKIQEMAEYLKARMADGPTLVNIYKIHDEAMRLCNEERAEAKERIAQRKFTLRLASLLCDVRDILGKRIECQGHGLCGPMREAYPELFRRIDEAILAVDMEEE